MMYANNMLVVGPAVLSLLVLVLALLGVYARSHIAAPSVVAYHEVRSEGRNHAGYRCVCVCDGLDCGCGGL